MQRRVDSDAYACNQACGERVINSGSRQQPRLHSALGADGKQPPSGKCVRGLSDRVFRLHASFDPKKVAYEE